MNRRSFFKMFLASLAVLATAPLSVFKPTATQAAEISNIKPDWPWPHPEYITKIWRTNGKTVFHTQSFYANNMDELRDAIAASSGEYSWGIQRCGPSTWRCSLTREWPYEPPLRILSASYAKQLAHGGEPITITF